MILSYIQSSMSFIVNSIRKLKCLETISDFHLKYGGETTRMVE